MGNFGDYFASSSSAKQIEGKKDVNFRHDSPHFYATASNHENNFHSPSPPNHNRAKTSYRSSYPPSNRELHDYAAEMKQFDDDGGNSPMPSGSSSRVPPDTNRRPRRSSLCQPGNRRRRNSSPPKHVRFSTTDTIFEPFDAQDSQTIDQIMQLLHLPKRSIPLPCIPATSSYSVLRRANASHEYPDVSPPTRNISSVAGSMHDEISPYAFDPRSRLYRAPGVEQQHSEGTSKRGRRHSDAYSYSTRAELQFPPRSPSHSGGQPPFRPSPSMHAPRPSRSRPRSRSEVAMPPVEYRSDIQPSFRGIPPQKRFSDAHYETHSQRQAVKHSEPHSRTRRDSFTSPTPELNRSSICSDETLVNPEMTWAPAAVMLEYPHTHVPPPVDEDKPVTFVANDGKSLRRKDAQRLPAVPRRHKLLHNIAKLFD